VTIRASGKSNGTRKTEGKTFVGGVVVVDGGDGGGWGFEAVAILYSWVLGRKWRTRNYTTVLQVFEENRSRIEKFSPIKWEHFIFVFACNEINTWIIKYNKHVFFFIVSILFQYYRTGIWWQLGQNAYILLVTSGQLGQTVKNSEICVSLHYTFFSVNQYGFKD